MAELTDGERTTYMQGPQNTGGGEKLRGKAVGLDFYLRTGFLFLGITVDDTSAVV